MTFCEMARDNFILTFLSNWLVGTMLCLFLPSAPFYCYYVCSTFEKWQRKTIKAFPSPKTVASEIVCIPVSTCFSSLVATASVALVANGYGQAYCSENHSNDTPISYLLQSVAIVVLLDVYEWAYHALCHNSKLLRTIHHEHHNFFNPTPFSFIAEDPMDHAIRVTPIIVIPLLVPVCIEVFLATVATFVLGYAIYIHLGFELDFILSAHNGILNTSYHHTVHHHGNPNCYFAAYFLIWDQLYGSVQPKCSCFRCRPRRSEREYQALKVPDYSVLWRDSSLWTSEMRRKYEEMCVWQCWKEILEAGEKVCTYCMNGCVLPNGSPNLYVKS